MVERQEVEALLATAQRVAPADAVFGEERIGVEGSTLAALCRAWLAGSSSRRCLIGTVGGCRYSGPGFSDGHRLCRHAPLSAW